MAKSIKKIAAVVTLGTLLSKSGGLLRQLLIAGAFGIGTAYDAYNYAYIIPGFFLILLGGINGPFHNGMVSILSNKSKKEGIYINNAVNTLVGSLLILVSFVIFFAADPLISIVGPGLTNAVHQVAVIQLKIMSPIAFISGLIGIGFGTLNAKSEFFIPSIAPLLSSLVLIICVGSFWIKEGEAIQSFELALEGGIVLAVGTFVGALLQWGIQIPSLIKKGFLKFKFVWDLKSPGVKEVLAIIGPATLASGMLQFNVFTDLFFASGILGAAAGLSYANFIVQAPLGLISNALLIPLLPEFSKLKAQEKYSALIKKIEQGLIFSTASMIFLAAILISLGHPIIELIFQRGAFDKTAVDLVSGLLVAYGLGMPAYLGRDLLVRVFYALGDAKTPFKLSSIGIGLNILFDWALVGGPSPWGNQLPFNLGAPGIVLATVFVNLITFSALLFQLKRNLGKLPIFKLSINLLKLLLSGFIASIVAFQTSSIIFWHQSYMAELIEIIFSASLAFITFLLATNYLKVKEVDSFFQILRKKIIHF